MYQSADDACVDVRSSEGSKKKCLCDSLGGSHVNQPPAGPLPFTLLFIYCCWGLEGQIRGHQSLSLCLSHSHTHVTNKHRLLAVASSRRHYQPSSSGVCFSPVWNNTVQFEARPARCSDLDPAVRFTPNVPCEFCKNQTFVLCLQFSCLFFGSCENDQESPFSCSSVPSFNLGVGLTRFRLFLTSNGESESIFPFKALTSSTFD